MNKRPQGEVKRLMEMMAGNLTAQVAREEISREDARSLMDHVEADMLSGEIHLEKYKPAMWPALLKAMLQLWYPNLKVTITKGTLFNTLDPLDPRPLIEQLPARDIVRVQHKDNDNRYFIQHIEWTNEGMLEIAAKAGLLS